MKTFRSVSLDILSGFFNRPGKLTSLIDQHRVQKKWPATWHGQVQESVLGTIRLYQPISDILRPRLKKTPPPDIDRALHLAVYELFQMDSIPPYATVNSWVDEIKSRKPGLAGLANAVLNGISREVSRADFEKTWSENIPEWFGSEFESVGTPETRDAWAAYMSNRPVQWAVDWSGEEKLVRIEDVPAALQSDGFLSGEQQFIDQSSWMVADYGFDPASRSMIDACCGPGGKLIIWAKRLGSDLKTQAIDLNRGHLDRLKTNLKRMGVSGEVTVNQTDLLTFQPQEPVDTVLLDVPCTGSGVMNRKPDIRFNRSEKDLKDLIALQRSFLDRAANWVRPNGRLIYSTCSVLWSENEQQILDFLARRPDFRLEINREFREPSLVTDMGLRTAPQGRPLDGACAFILIRHA